MDAKVYRRGIPTDPDVEKLMTAIQPKIGTTTPYSVIEEAINCERNTSRFHAVTRVWRARLERDFNIIVKAICNQGYEFLDSRARVDFSGKMASQGTKKIIRAGHIARKTDRDGLSQEEIRALDHVSKVGAQFRLAEQVAPKTIELPV